MVIEGPRLRRLLDPLPPHCGLASIGFALDASVKGPAQVPTPPTLSISFPPGSPAPLSLSIDSFLQQVRGQPELILTATGKFAPHQKDSSWSVDARGFTGYVRPRQPAVKTARLPGEGPHESYLYGESTLSTVPGAGFLTVNLCWRSGAPLVTSGCSGLTSCSVSPAPAHF